MTVTMKPETREQDEAFGAFIREWKGLWADITNGLERLGITYRACIARGMDMSPEVLEKHADMPRNICLLVKKVAEGKLTPQMAAKLLTGADMLIEIVSAASPEVKKAILADGAPVADDVGQVRMVPLDKLKTHEARRAIDSATGRLRSPEEQVAYARPAPAPKRDKPVTVYLTPEQYQDLWKEARRKEQSPETYILRMLIREGVIERRKTTRAKSAENHAANEIGSAP